MILINIFCLIYLLFKIRITKYIIYSNEIHIKIAFFHFSKCDVNGFLKDGINSYTRFYNSKLPSVYDVIYDNSELIVLLSLHAEIFSKKTPNQEYDIANWFCKFKKSNNIYVNHFIISDPNRRMKVLKFNVPEEIIQHSNGIVDVFTPDLNLTFDNLQFCRLNPNYDESKNFAALYTEQIATNPERIINWLNWHLSEGFNHFFIYVNDNSINNMKKNLLKFLKAGILTLVNWNWPQSINFQDQVPGQMSCLYRNKRRFKWIAMNDIDEAFLPINNGTVTDSLKEYESKRSEIGSIAAPNRFFVESSRFTSNPICSKKIDPFPVRQKCIINPDNVNYVSVHIVTDGKLEIHSNKLINAHFKSKQWLLNNKRTDFTNCIFQNRHLKISFYNKT